MIRRLRPALLVLALLLTGLAVDSRAQASQCVEGDHEWVNFGECCWQLSPPTGLLRLIRCINGEWVAFSTYKCPPTEPC